MLRRARRAVGGRRVSPWPDYSRLARARTQRPREAHSARTSPWILTRRLQQQHQQRQSVTLCRNTKFQDRLTSAHSEYLFAARPEAVSAGSDAWVQRAVQRTRRVSSQRQTIRIAVGLGVCSNLCTHNEFYFSA